MTPLLRRTSMKNQQPRACSAFARLLGKSVIKLSGWRIKGEVPQYGNIVVIAAPHTSNWDFILLIAAAYSFGISVNWLGKNTLFSSPLGPILRFFGGISVDRSKPTRPSSAMSHEYNRARLLESSGATV